jgi:prevent-host-death family protein
MAIVNIHDAKTNFSRLVDQAAAGEEIIIAKAGKPVARLVPLARAHRSKRRLGLAAGKLRVPADFDRMFADEIAVLFGTRPR